MTRLLSTGCAFASIFALLAACSSSTEPGTTPPPSGTSGSGGTSSGTAGSGGTQSTTQPQAGSGGSSSSSAGTSAGTSNGTAGATGGSASGGAGGTGGTPTGGASTGGSGGTASGTTPPEGPFACSMYIGAYLSMEWWNAGFQDKVDGDKWQLKWHHHGHITEWAKADSPFWADTGDPNNDAQGSPIQSPCTEASNAPDRIVFLAISWALTTKDTWLTALKADIANIKAKYPSVKRVDVMTMIRCPMNMKCNPNQMYGIEDSDTNAGHQDCQVPDYADQAIAELIASDPGYVALGPQFEMTMCNPSHDGAHMTGTDNGIAATKMAEFYNARK